MQFIKKFIYDSKSIFLYAFSMAILVFVLNWLQWRYLISENSIDIYIGIIAVFFTAFGIWIATQLSNKYASGLIEEVLSNTEHSQINERELSKFQFTSREYEVLQQISMGRSNSEIAENLFLSLSTVKTHASNLYSKFDVKSRTQAIEKANRLNIVN